ncbi:substrate-binding domain-containing protein [Streptomyces sp. NPDC050534]|uniref:substrate-binding domain-containing protein n=1 Tax=Streptomyces sp. NPDC050534 TaxID=3365625 RepID=UPI0037A300A4
MDQVGVDNTESIAVLVDHLTSIGHTRSAMPTGRVGLTTTVERHAGYRLGLRRNGIEVRPDYEANGDPSEDGAETALRQLLSLSNHPLLWSRATTACPSAPCALCCNAGLKVPGDMALASFGDFEWADLFHLRLTAMAQPALSIGEQAVSMALSRIASPSLPPAQGHHQSHFHAPRILRLSPSRRHPLARAHRAPGPRHSRMRLPCLQTSRPTAGKGSGGVRR